MAKCIDRRKEPFHDYLNGGDVKLQEPQRGTSPRLQARQRGKQKDSPPARPTPPTNEELSQIQHHSTWNIKLLVKCHPNLSLNLCQASKTKLLKSP